MNKTEDRCYLDWEVADAIAVSALKDQLKFAKEQMKSVSVYGIGDVEYNIELIHALKKVLNHFGENV